MPSGLPSSSQPSNNNSLQSLGSALKTLAPIILPLTPLAPLTPLLPFLPQISQGASKVVQAKTPDQVVNGLNTIFGINNSLQNPVQSPPTFTPPTPIPSASSSPNPPAPSTSLGGIPVLLSIQAESGFQFNTTIIPDDLTITKSATLRANDIMNRSTPIYTYAESGAVDISFSLPLIAYDNNKLSPKVINDLTKAFESLTYPMEPGVQGPPLCDIYFNGSSYHYQGVCTNFSNSLGAPLKTYEADGTSHSNTVHLTFTCFDITNQGVTDIMTGQTEFDYSGFGNTNGAGSGGSGGGSSSTTGLVNSTPPILPGIPAGVPILGIKTPFPNIGP